MVESSKPLLIFDFDGTLANTFSFGVEIFNEIADDYGLNTVTVDEVKELRKLNTRAVLDHLGISTITVVKLGAHIRKILHARMDEVDPIDGAREAILSLHEDGFRMGILSSNSVSNIKLFLERIQIEQCFSFVEAGVSLFGKPQRISNVLRKRDVDPRDVIYVGDETRDMEAARKTKVCGLAVCWGANDKDAMRSEGPDYCIESPVDLLSCARDFDVSR